MVIIFSTKTKITKRADTSSEVSALIFYSPKVLPDSNNIKLKANQKYVYGGWINSDGSINLKLQPIDKLKKLYGDYLGEE